MISKREIAYRKILKSITSGGLRPGEKLVEKEICDKFKLGRTPLREALRQLQMEEYIDVIHNKGAVIRKMSNKEIKEIYDIVAMLEGNATEIATRCIKASDKKKLKELHNQLKKLGQTKNYRGWLEKNAKFHGFLSEASENYHLTKVIDGLRKRIYNYRFMAITIPGHINEYISHHEEILKAVVEGEEKVAGSAMRRHVLRVKEVLVEFLEQYPNY